MKRYRADLSYDGTQYAGWQVQPGAETVQGCLEGALQALARCSARVHGSGRTDRGVHARRQVAHFELPPDRPFAAPDLRTGLNALLPADIRVLRVTRASRDFDARRCARVKEYRYFIWNARDVPPFIRRYRCAVGERLDVRAMNAAAAELEGTHDFGAFTANPSREVLCRVRRLMRLGAARHGREVVIVARGDGFLFRMVRSLAGYLIRVGKGELDPAGARALLNSRERTARVPTAPACGLFLWNVWY